MIPSPRTRAVVAAIIGGVCGLATYAVSFRPGFQDHDFKAWWLAAGAVLGGRNPYADVVWSGGGPGFLYPLPAALAATPFTVFTPVVAASVFIALTCGLLAYVVTREAWWPLLMFASGSMAVSVGAAQFSPLLMLAFLLPGAAALGAIKPNIGLAALAYRPSWRSAAAMLVVGGISVAVRPTWPMEWLDALRASSLHPAPIRTMGGPLLLFALVRWRRPEARLIAAMAVLPSSPIAYEALPLFVIPENRREMMALSIASCIGVVLMGDLTAPEHPEAFMARGQLVMFGCHYLPALILVLRRPNAAPIARASTATVTKVPEWTSF